MARHHSALHRKFDLKPIAFRVMKGVTGSHPVLRKAVSFFPDFGWPDAAKVDLREDSIRSFNLLQERYSRQRTFVRSNDVDVTNPHCRFQDPDSAHRVIAFVADVLIPGHTLTPVDASTGRQLAFDTTADSNWHFAYPSPAVLRTRHVEGAVAAIPPYKHYGHLLTDVLMPLAYALHRGTLAPGEQLTIVTARSVNPMVQSFIEGLRGIGVRVSHVKLAPWERVRAGRYLYARSHCCNLERVFATPEALGYARSIFDAAYAGRPRPEVAPRIYLTRGQTRLRRVEGEGELIEGLRGRGFRIVEASWANHHEQIYWFGEAKTVMAVHGAGLANILWARRQPLLIELMAQNARKSTGLHWAAEVGADYEPLVGGPEGQRQAFSIDPAAILREVDAVLERSPAL
ncbi:MAG TPA: glycosyltransferase family 61 protein [Microvirga sp.]|nr:glycosyltransferase family 61 protein [Microvirga sp.]